MNQITGAYARGARGLASPNGCMIVHYFQHSLHASQDGLAPDIIISLIINDIIVSGEAILSTENSGKPLGGRDSAPHPAPGALTAVPQTPSWWGWGCCPFQLSKNPLPALGHFGLASPPPLKTILRQRIKILLGVLQSAVIRNGNGLQYCSLSSRDVSRSGADWPTGKPGNFPVGPLTRGPAHLN